MALFGKKKKENAEACCTGCDCGKEQSSNVKIPEGSIKEIKVLGSGCAKCNQLEESARKALDQLGLDIPIGHVTDFAEISAYGVMSTPALVVNGQVVSYGKVLRVGEIIEILGKTENKTTS